MTLDFQIMKDDKFCGVGEGRRGGVYAREDMREPYKDK